MGQIDSKRGEATLAELAERGELLTISELAGVLRVPQGWIYARTRERSPDSLPFFKVGKYLRFRASEIEAWLQNRHQGWRPDE